jgi:hypothetical protein
MSRKPNKSVVLLITSISLGTYIFYPGYFLDMAGKAFVLMYVRITDSYDIQSATTVENIVILVTSL